MARQTLGTAVVASLKTLDIKPSDAAAVKLTKTYAKCLDEVLEQYEAGEVTISTVERMLKYGPSMLNALKELGATPASRKAMEGEVAAASSSVDELRAKRASRAATR